MMNKFYTKLEIDFKDFDYSSLKGELFYQYQGRNLSYYFINDESKIKQLLPKTLLEISTCEIKLVEIPGLSDLPPHRDYGISASINFYFNPGSAKTFWYEEKEGAKEKLSHESKSRLYQSEDLILVDSFTAKLNECYIINNSQIHSVEKHDPSIRQFIQIQFDLSYDDILQKFGAASRNRT